MDIIPPKGGTKKAEPVPSPESIPKRKSWVTELFARSQAPAPEPLEQLPFTSEKVPPVTGSIAAFSEVKKPEKGEKQSKEPLFEDLGPVKVFPDYLPKKRKRKWIAAGGSGMVIILFLLSLLLVPPVRVVITPQKDHVKKDVLFEATQAVDRVVPDTRAIPGERLVVTKILSNDFQATGQEEKKVKASGVVMITNSYSPAPQILVRSTRLLSADGKLFRTAQTVTVPGVLTKNGVSAPGRVSVEVVADKPGADYNIGPSMFTLPSFQGTSKFTSITGQSQEAMRGGILGPATVVSDMDIVKATDVVKDKVLSVLATELSSKLLPGFLLLDGAKSFEVVSVEALPPKGEPGETFRLQMRATLSALVFRAEDAASVAHREVLKNFPEPRVIDPKTERLTFQVSSMDLAAGTMQLGVSVEGNAVGKVDGKQLSAKIAGKSLQAAEQVLSSEPGIKRARLTFWPPWVSYLPDDPAKIVLTIEGS